MARYRSDADLVTATESACFLAIFAIDEHPRGDTTIESLSKLKPVMRSVDPDATVTADNASGQNDAAAARIVASPEEVGRLGLKPMARLVTWAVAGGQPNRMSV